MLITWLNLGEIQLKTFFSEFVLVATKQLYEWSFRPFH